MLVPIKTTREGPPVILWDIWHHLRYLVSMLFFNVSVLLFYVWTFFIFQFGLFSVFYFFFLLFPELFIFNYSFNFRIPVSWYFRYVLYSVLFFRRYILPLISSDRRFQQLSHRQWCIYWLCKLCSKMAWKIEALFCVLSDFIFSFDILYLRSILTKNA